MVNVTVIDKSTWHHQLYDLSSS